jgi:uncharacterized protein (DUF1330 family)
MKMVLVATAKSGKTREAVSALKSVVGYAGSKYSATAETYMQVFGGVAGTFYIMIEYKDLASAQAAQAQIMADEKYWELVQKMADVMAGPPTIALLQPI